MLGSSNHQTISVLVEASEKNVFTANFDIHVKKKTQIALIHTLIETCVLYFKKPVDPDPALRLGMVPNAFSRLAYDGFRVPTNGLRKQ
jgi:hypothetical protein